MDSPVTHSPTQEVDYWPVAVFAHNLEGQIASCLKSLEAASEMHKLQVFVLENGSRDKTAAVVESLSGHFPFPVQLVRIGIGDKANAWNVFVHDITPAGDIVFFVDGDVQVLPRAFDYLFEALVRKPTALAATAFPHSGRSAAAIRQYVLEKHELCGNLYALRSDTIKKIRALDVRIPFGYIGDDDFLSFLLLFNFDPTCSTDLEKIVPCSEALFYYQSLSLRNWQDWQLYYRRKKRYSLRHFQDQMLFRALKAHGLPALPRNVVALYQMASHHMDPIRSSPSWLWWDWLAKKAIRKALESSQSQHTSNCSSAFAPGTRAL